MKVYELIAELQNFDSNLEVECLQEITDWVFNGSHSVEQTSTDEGPVTLVESWTNESNKKVVRIS